MCANPPSVVIGTFPLALDAPASASDELIRLRCDYSMQVVCSTLKFIIVVECTRYPTEYSTVAFTSNCVQATACIASMSSALSPPSAIRVGKIRRARPILDPGCEDGAYCTLWSSVL